MTAWGPFDLTGKRAVVTGGAMGIGGGIAEWFVRAGASVVIADLDSDTAKKTAETLSEMGPGTAVAVHVDISRDDAGEMLVAAAVDHFGGLDILVNNAGIYPQVPVLQMEPALLDKVLLINLRALILVSKSAGLKFAEQGTGGAIINVASIDAIHPSMVGLGAYDASKGGVRMFTKAFALEMAEYGVKVNGIAPGGITTPGTTKPLEGSGMTPEQQAEMIAGFAANIPMKRMGTPDDIGKVALFLASDAASYITGEILVVDGGKLIT
jgi:2-dehydro-3-deoxy-D-gluconate 5-dehydrogenase